jgi:hypothetical protein
MHQRQLKRCGQPNVIADCLSLRERREEERGISEERRVLIDPALTDEKAATTAFERIADSLFNSCRGNVAMTEAEEVRWRAVFLGVSEGNLWASIRLPRTYVPTADSSPVSHSIRTFLRDSRPDRVRPSCERRTVSSRDAGRGRATAPRSLCRP